MKESDLSVMQKYIQCIKSRQCISIQKFKEVKNDNLGYNFMDNCIGFLDYVDRTLKQVGLSQFSLSGEEGEEGALTSIRFAILKEE